MTTAGTWGLFTVLFWQPAATLVRDWVTDADAGHGLLLAPLALYLALRSGIAADARPQPRAGLAMLAAAVLIRWLGELAAELFTLRASLLLAGAAMVVWRWGGGQLRRWWLPAALCALSVPIPDVLVATVALPLQLRASAIGAALLEWRHVPVRLNGNLIELPGRTLFVTEACSGLRSLSALLAIGVLVGGLWLRSPPLRLLVIAVAIPLAVALNGTRVFLTGFLVHFAGPAAGEGFLHWSEGWAMFAISFAVLVGLTMLLARLERTGGTP